MPPGGVTTGGVVPAAHMDESMTLLMRLIWPFRASTRPLTEAPLFNSGDAFVHIALDMLREARRERA